MTLNFGKPTVVFAALMGFLLGVHAARAETLVSNPSSGPDIYVAWNAGGNPINNVNFTVSFSDSANPDVELITGNATWNVRSENDDTSPGNIGTISLSPSSSTADFDLTILDGSNPGAANVESVVLNAGSWTGHSSIKNATITGNLTGNLTVIKDSGNDGGEIDGLTIQGNVSSGSTIRVPVLTGLKIEGDLNGDIDNDPCMIGSADRALDVSGKGGAEKVSG